MACFIETLRLRQGIGDRRGVASTFNNLGLTHMQLGAYARAKAYFEQALSLWREVGDQQGEGLTLANLGLLYHNLGKNNRALGFLQQSLEIAVSLNNRSTEANALTSLGHVLSSLGDFEQADITYHKALRLRQDLGQPSLAQELLAGLARLHLTKGDLTQASAFVEDILSHPKADNIEGLDEPFLIFLICYRVLRASNDPRAQSILEKAYNLLQERVASITDEALRRSYLENVVAHREILAAWSANRP
jgi:tetratricopeptide (TPR) repeat protein